MPDPKTKCTSPVGLNTSRMPATARLKRCVQASPEWARTGRARASRTRSSTLTGPGIIKNSRSSMARLLLDFRGRSGSGGDSRTIPHAFGLHAATLEAVQAVDPQLLLGADPDGRASAVATLQPRAHARANTSRATR